MGILDRLSVFSKKFTTIAVAASLTLSTLVWVGEPHFIKYIDNRLGVSTTQARGGPCVTFPSGGHSIGSGYIGEWADVEWVDLIKHRDDCGRPELTGVISNGDGILHDAPLSIEGVIVPVGNFDINYAFFINDRVAEGRGRFRVFLTYPNAVGGAPPVISPWVSFNIRKRTEE